MDTAIIVIIIVGILFLVIIIAVILSFSLKNGSKGTVARQRRQSQLNTSRNITNKKQETIIAPIETSTDKTNSETSTDNTNIETSVIDGILLPIKLGNLGDKAVLCKPHTIDGKSMVKDGEGYCKLSDGEICQSVIDCRNDYIRDCAADQYGIKRCIVIETKPILEIMREF